MRRCALSANAWSSSGSISWIGRIAPARQVLFVLALALSACADLVSDPEDTAVALPAQSDLVAIVHSVNDVRDRIAPLIGAGPVGTRLRASIDDMATALNGANGPAADKAVQAALILLPEYIESEMEAAALPEMGVVEITLLRVNSLLQRPCSRAARNQGMTIQASCQAS